MAKTVGADNLRNCFGTGWFEGIESMENACAEYEGAGRCDAGAGRCPIKATVLGNWGDRAKLKEKFDGIEIVG